jgi:hypothetical protein
MYTIFKAGLSHPFDFVCSCKINTFKCRTVHERLFWQRDYLCIKLNLSQRSALLEHALFHLGNVPWNMHIIKGSTTITYIPFNLV